MGTAAIIVAAGRGQRAGAALPKQYQLLLGKPVLRWSAEAFVAAGVNSIVVAVSPAQRATAEAALAGIPGAIFVDGGETRTASVRNALARAGEVDAILIHDAARPGLRPALVRQLAGAIEGGAEAVAPALSIPDSLRRVENGVLSDVSRNGVMRVQTPQAFRGDIIRRAYAVLPADASLSDDLAVASAAGASVILIPGDERLRKLTYSEDFGILERLMSDAVTCVGSGFDAHRFGEGDHVTLCGVRIAHDKGLVGHSDADAGWHALVDAILGALGEGDIGAHFPPSDTRWKGANSEAFLRHAVALADKGGARVVHADITLICEAPKIGPHRETMRARTAEVLGLSLAYVSVKATTTERMGFTGRGEGLAAQAHATVERPRSP